MGQKMTNTNRDAKRVRDAFVAKGMGWEFFKLEMAFGKTAFVAYPLGEDLSGLPITFEKSTFEELVETKNRQISKHTIPPFRSAPTYETDGVVYDWLKEQDTELKQKVKDVLANLSGNPEVGFDFAFAYKPGMYALALEAVMMEERDNE